MISISFDGRKLFEWEGTSRDLAGIEQEIERVARANDMPQEALAIMIVGGMANEGGFLVPEHDLRDVTVADKERSREMQMSVSVWWLLDQPTDHADHPGFRDYIDVWDFNFNVVPTPTGLKVEINGGFGGSTMGVA
jgi:hypothetical protein